MVSLQIFDNTANDLERIRLEMFSGTVVSSVYKFSTVQVRFAALTNYGWNLERRYRMS